MKFCAINGTEMRENNRNTKAFIIQILMQLYENDCINPCEGKQLFTQFDWRKERSAEEKVRIGPYEFTYLSKKAL